MARSTGTCAPRASHCEGARPGITTPTHTRVAATNDRGGHTHALVSSKRRLSIPRAARRARRQHWHRQAASRRREATGRAPPERADPHLSPRDSSGMPRPRKEQKTPPRGPPCATTRATPDPLANRVENRIDEGRRRIRRNRANDRDRLVDHDDRRHLIVLEHLPHGHAHDGQVYGGDTIQPGHARVRRDQRVDATQVIRHTGDDLNRKLRQRSLSRGDDTALAQKVAQHVGVRPHPALIGLVHDVGRALAGLRARREAVLLRHYSVTRPEYEPSRVSTLTRVPSSMKRGTWIS